jgi:hypothetical protein
MAEFSLAAMLEVFVSNADISDGMHRLLSRVVSVNVV